jgi:signal transduction histidine kinase
MRSALRQPAILELCPPADRFEVEDGEVLVEANVGWLVAMPTRPLDDLSQEQLTAAEQAEFVEGDADLASKHFDALRLRLVDEDPRSLLLLARAGWQAHRANQPDKVTQLLQQLNRDLDAQLQGNNLAALADPHVANALAASTLLAAARNQQPSDSRWQQIAALPSELATATLRRLAEYGLRNETAEQQLLANSQRRAVLKHAATLLRGSAQFGPVQASQGKLALWFPNDPPGSGSGAIVDPTWLQQLPGLATQRDGAFDLPPIPHRGRVSLQPDAAGEAILNGLAWAVPEQLPEQAFWTQPTAVLAAGIGLLLLFGGTVWATMRGLSRETAAMRARTEFLSGVTHELKTPVAAMRLIADVLHDDEVAPDRQRQYFAMLAAESARLSALIDNVLDLGQMERGERAYDLRKDDATDVVRETVTAYQPLGNDAGMTIHLQEGALEALCSIDRGAITQALLNLLENARKYAKDGKRIDVLTSIENGNFIVQVRDHGPGVPIDEQERIFARFQRGKRQQSGSIAGVGLGLFLSRSILAHHHGTLTCLSPTSGDGAVFQITLPLQPPAEAS